MNGMNQMSIFIIMLFLAAGSSASALEAKQPALTSGVTGTVSAAASASDAKQPALSSENQGKASALVKIDLRVPLSSPRFSSFPVALVNDDQVMLGALANAVAHAHESRDDKKHAGKIDYLKMLDRLINIRLFVQEAIRMGFDEMTEYKNSIDAYSSATLLSLLKAEITKDAKVDPIKLEQRYKETVEEWKIRSLMFEKKEDAQKALDSLTSGISFDEMAKKAIADKKALGDEKEEYVKPNNLRPQIAAAVSSMATNSVSPVITIELQPKKQGFVICKLEDKRYPENPEARKQVEETLLAEKGREMIGQKVISLFNSKVTIKKRRLNGLDYDSAKADYDELRADTRVVAEIDGDKPVTVGELTSALETKYYHGMEIAAREKRINNSKEEVLHDILEKKLLRGEEFRRGLDKSEQYQNMSRENSDSLLFGMFLQKVIIPDIGLTEEQMKDYYQNHKTEYLYPEMMKLTSLAFKSKKEAQSALEKLKKGTDINWVRTNAEGLVDKKDAEMLSFEDRIITTKSMPEEMRKSVADARAGDFRLYEAPEGSFCVIEILDIIPARQQPYKEVRETISRAVFDESVSKSVEDWGRKLRAVAKIEVYLAGGGK